MTYEEAVAILGEEACTRIDEQLGPPKPLTDSQIALLVGLLSIRQTADHGAANSDAA